MNGKISHANARLKKAKVNVLISGHADFRAWEREGPAARKSAEVWVNSASPSIRWCNPGSLTLSI
jgi:hypothetical protein